uniref:Uncharacterized protein n=1 Tax=Plectus sambesii TaxID=2011161 RepID=A0A914VA85_9BILA
MLGLRAFQYAGPFVAVGLVLCGFINTFIYAHKHRDIRHAIRVLTSAKNVTLSHTESNIVSSLPPVRAFNESVTKRLRKDRDDVDRRVAQIHRFSNIASLSDCDEIFV